MLAAQVFMGFFKRTVPVPASISIADCDFTSGSCCWATAGYSKDITTITNTKQ